MSHTGPIAGGSVVAGLLLLVFINSLVQRRYPKFALRKRKSNESNSEYQKLQLDSKEMTQRTRNEDVAMTELEVAATARREMTGHFNAEAYGNPRNEVGGNARSELGGHARHEAPGEQLEAKELDV